jgi:hypothetical protein
MRNSTVVGLAIVTAAACAFILGSRAKAAPFDSPPAPGVASIQPGLPPSDPIPPLEPSLAPETEKLRAYLLTAMQDWPRARIAAVPYEDVAYSIAEAEASRPPWQRSIWRKLSCERSRSACATRSKGQSKPAPPPPRVAEPARSSCRRSTCREGVVKATLRTSLGELQCGTRKLLCCMCGSPVELDSARRSTPRRPR